MPDSLELGSTLNYIGVVPLCVIAVYAFMRDWIVSGRRLRRVENDRDRWEAIALEAMRVSASAIVPAAETVHRLVTHLPDPGADAKGGSP
jgi:hypothetical protein